MAKDTISNAENPNSTWNLLCATAERVSHKRQFSSAERKQLTKRLAIFEKPLGTLDEMLDKHFDVANDSSFSDRANAFMYEFESSPLYQELQNKIGEFYSFSTPDGRITHSEKPEAAGREWTDSLENDDFERFSKHIINDLLKMACPRLKYLLPSSPNEKDYDEHNPAISSNDLEKFLEYVAQRDRNSKISFTTVALGSLLAGGIGAAIALSNSNNKPATQPHHLPPMNPPDSRQTIITQPYPENFNYIEGNPAWMEPFAMMDLSDMALFQKNFPNGILADGEQISAEEALMRLRLQNEANNEAIIEERDKAFWTSRTAAPSAPYQGK